MKRLCVDCGIARDLSDLLIVRDRVTRREFYVCRPTLPASEYPVGFPCFRRAVGPADRYTLQLPEAAA